MGESYFELQAEEKGVAVRNTIPGNATDAIDIAKLWSESHPDEQLFLYRVERHSPVKSYVTLIAYFSKGEMLDMQKNS